MTRSIRVLLFALPLAVVADLLPFFDPKKNIENLEVAEHFPRKLKALKTQAIQRRRLKLLQKFDLDETQPDSEDVGQPPERSFLKNRPLLKKHSKKGGAGSGNAGQAGLGQAGEGGKESGNDNGNDGGGDEDEPAAAADMAFVLVRDEVDSPSPEGEVGVASNLGMNGYVYDIVLTSSGGEQPTYDGTNDPIGLFKGFCTMTSKINDELICTYEIYLTTAGEYGVAGIVVNGPVGGPENIMMVTGAEYDFSTYRGGSLTTLQDPELPVLFAYLSMV